jgi:hypothetical protein
MSFAKPTCICDQCDKSRLEDANHWMTIRCDSEGLTFKEGISNLAYHACGHNCASIILSNWMTTKKVVSFSQKGEAK